MHLIRLVWRWESSWSLQIFRKNYSFVLQDAAQGFHWNNSQATLHPFIAYYLHGFGRDTPCELSGDFWRCPPWYCSCPPFQRSFIAFLKELLPARLHPKKIIYFSDGAALQYKNRKNFLNLCLHKDDFGVKAEWHFQPPYVERGYVMVWVEQSSDSLLVPACKGHTMTS